MHRHTPAPSRATQRRVRALAAVVAIVVLAAAPVSAHATAARLSLYHLEYGVASYRTTAPGSRGDIGVATFNARKELSVAKTAEDAYRLTGRSDVDIVGWQEANNLAGVYQGLSGSGWTTVQPQSSSGAALELAVSWRASEFSLVASQLVKMHDPSPSRAGTDRPFPSRYVLEVTLQRTGDNPDQITVFDTHVNQHIERWDNHAPGVPYDNLNAVDARRHLAALEPMVAASETRYAVVTGDFNWDYVADQRTLRPDFVQGRLGGIAIPCWKAFGIAHQPVSHPSSRRRIDYVFLTKRSPAKFRSQSVLTGYNSDHRPVLVRLALD